MTLDLKSLFHSETIGINTYNTPYDIFVGVRTRVLGNCFLIFLSISAIECNSGETILAHALVLTNND